MFHAMSSTVPPLARTYDTLRPKVLQRLLDMRATLDPSFGRLDEPTARAQISAVLEHLGNFLATGDLGMHRAFLQTFIAMRAAEAQGPAAVLAMLVAVGDTAAQVAQDELAGTIDGRRAHAAADPRHRDDRARGQRSRRRRARAPDRAVGRAVGARAQRPAVVTQTVSQQGIRVAGDTNVGKVRTTNEDSMIVDPVRGLYVVLDGMGGANAGDVASQTARDAIREFVMQRRLTMEPKCAARSGDRQHGSATVFNAAQETRERHGMGTTVVGCIVIDPTRAVDRARRR